LGHEVKVRPAPGAGGGPLSDPNPLLGHRLGHDRPGAEARQLKTLCGKSCNGSPFPYCPDSPGQETGIIMRVSPLLASFLTLVFPSPQPPAADLTKIDRTIAKEPAYKGNPKYCLLVFGAEAKTRVWLVLDGDVLHVDRNGNGDLSEAPKRCLLSSGN